MKNENYKNKKKKKERKKITKNEKKIKKIARHYMQTIVSHTDTTICDNLNF